MGCRYSASVRAEEPEPSQEQSATEEVTSKLPEIGEQLTRAEAVKVEEPDSVKRDEHTTHAEASTEGERTTDVESSTEVDSARPADPPIDDSNTLSALREIRGDEPIPEAVAEEEPEADRGDEELPEGPVVDGSGLMGVCGCCS
mmetsp:Transcript_48065/g.127266  ORF Transcript_48065/g.127266 Transcript_48065/m.127266 type:complete len:144 (-) Transcript_48065:260-691(-)